jgi:hydroxymethylglutaryl-CoA synthase
VVGEALGLRKDIISFDLQFAGKSGTSALIAALALVESGQVDYALAIGADTINRHIPPGHWMEYGASAGAVALLVGKEPILAQVVGHFSYAQDQSDSFRVEGDRYIQVGSGVTGYAYGWGIDDNMIPAGKGLFRKLGISSDDVDDCALHQNSINAPYSVCRPLELDFTKQVYPNVLTPQIGDCGAASSLLSLAYILDKSEPEGRILLGSYGNGAGSDFLYLQTRPEINSYQNEERTTKDSLADKLMLDYGTAQKYEYKYMRANLVTGNL